MCTLDGVQKSLPKCLYEGIRCSYGRNLKCKQASEKEIKSANLDNTVQSPNVWNDVQLKD